MPERRNYTGEIVNAWITGWVLVRSDDGDVESLVRDENVDGSKMIGTHGSIQYRDDGVYFSSEPTTP